MVTLLLQEAGIPFTPPSSASFLGLAIAYVYTNVPLFVLLTLPAMGVVRGDGMEAAAVWAPRGWSSGATSGCRCWRRFWPPAGC